MRGALLALLICAATRLLVWVCAYSGALLELRMYEQFELPSFASDDVFVAASTRSDSPLGAAIRENLWNFQPLLKWDAPRYRSIVEKGYEYHPPGAQIPPGDDNCWNIAFFPLYPLLCWLLMRAGDALHAFAGVPPLGAAAAMVLVANLAALAAAPLIYAAARGFSDHAIGLMAVTLTYAWPTACFFCFGYAESVTLLLIALLIVLAQRQRFGWAALVAALATASRPTAICLPPILALLYLITSRRPLGRRLLVAVGLGVVASAGALAYAGYLTWQFGSPLVYNDNLRDGWIGQPPPEAVRAFWTSSRVWNQFKWLGRIFRDLPLSLTLVPNPMTWNMPLSFAVVLLSLGGMFRVPRGLACLLLIAPLIFVQRYLATSYSDFAMQSMARYLTIAVPAFIVLAGWSMREWHWSGRAALLAALLLLQASWATFFGMTGWAG